MPRKGSRRTSGTTVRRSGIHRNQSWRHHIRHHTISGYRHRPSYVHAYRRSYSVTRRGLAIGTKSRFKSSWLFWWKSRTKRHSTQSGAIGLKGDSHQQITNDGGTTLCPMTIAWPPGTGPPQNGNYQTQFGEQNTSDVALNGQHQIQYEEHNTPDVAYGGGRPQTGHQNRYERRALYSDSYSSRPNTSDSKMYNRQAPNQGRDRGRRDPGKEEKGGCCVVS